MNRRERRAAGHRGRRVPDQVLIGNPAMLAALNPQCPEGGRGDDDGLDVLGRFAAGEALAAGVGHGHRRDDGDVFLEQEPPDDGDDDDSPTKPSPLNTDYWGTPDDPWTREGTE